MTCKSLACLTADGCLEPVLVEGGGDEGCVDGQVIGCVDGVPTWVSGTLTFDNTSDCFAGGVGPGYMIRNANINGTVLQILGAPEHYTNTATVFDGGRAWPQGTLPTADVGGLIPLSLTMNNPSPCRVMKGVVQFGAPQFFVTKPLGDPNMSYASYMTVKINGVAMDNIPSRTDAYFDVSNGAGFQLSIDTQTMPYILPFTIPANGSVLLESSLNIVVLQPNTNGVMGLGVRRITAWGTTTA